MRKRHVDWHEFWSGTLTFVVIALIFTGCIYLINESQRGTVYLNDGTVVQCDHLSNNDGVVQCDDVNYSSSAVNHFEWNS